MRFEMPVDDDQSLEAMLRSLKLREPGGRMDSRVDAVFANHRAYAPRRLTLHRIGWHRMAIAAGILLAIGIGVRLSLPHRQPTVATVATPPSHPIEIETDTSTVIDDGVVARTHDAVYEQYRHRTVREIWYEDPGTHAKWQVTIPTELVVIQKVEAY